MIREILTFHPKFPALLLLSALNIFYYFNNVKKFSLVLSNLDTPDLTEISKRVGEIKKLNKRKFKPYLMRLNFPEK